MRAYQTHLVGRRVSWGALNQTVCALRFFYGVTPGRSDDHLCGGLTRRGGGASAGDGHR
ncbi:hypothetical protein NKL06_11435 [Mesorhizobium sp. C268A]|uniref:hypothetical protein n=1 Tax=Mesorhizobium sp. LSJC268A00 TaxID=1287325 RepID=UPI001FDA53C9|nr:hypothetical protein [Mesorhizobium sp. LSJC268A00]